MNKIYYTLILSFFTSYMTACTAGLERKMDRQLKEIRAIQAEQTSAITEIRHDVRGLTGRLDEIQHSSQGRTQELESAIQQLGSRVPPPSGVPEDLLIADEQSIMPNQSEAAEKYKNGLKFLRAGNFERSHLIFKQFAANNPGTAYTDNAFFWSGISSMKLGRFERAIGEFSEAFENYPAEDMVAPSYYYMADALFTLGMGNDGVLTLQKLIDDFPKSDYAGKAKERLKEASPSR